MLDDLSTKYLEKYKTEEAATQALQYSLNLRLWQNDKTRSIFIDKASGRPEIEVNSVRLAYRTSSSVQSLSDLVVEINQRRRGYLDPQKQAEADRERRAKIIHAEGEFQASQKLADAAQVIGKQPIAMHLRFLQSLVEVSADNNSTIVLPVPLDLLKHFLT